jgi:hypothetical protein
MLTTGSMEMSMTGSEERQTVQDMRSRIEGDVRNYYADLADLAMAVARG